MQFYLFTIHRKIHHRKKWKLHVTLPVNRRNMHVLFGYVVWETITWEKANLHENRSIQTMLEYLEYFCQMSSKSVFMISSYTV